MKCFALLKSACCAGLLVILAASGAYAAPKPAAGTTWSKVYDKPSAYSWNYDLKGLPDGGFVTVGSWSDSASSGCWKLMVRRMDARGTLVWEKAFGGECLNAMAGSSGHSVTPTSDGGFIIAGTRNSSNLAAKRHTWEELWVLKLSSSGQLQWEKRYGHQWASTAMRGHGFSVIEAAGGGYLVGGTGYPKNDDAWVFKLDANGTKLWEHILPGYHSTEEYQRMVPVCQLTDGTIVAAYPATNGMNTVTRITMMRSDGSPIRSLQFGGRETLTFDLLPTKDGGFVAGGTTRPFLGSSFASFAGFLIGFDAVGKWLWDREYPGGLH